MKVGQISHVYFPHIGGIEHYVYRLNKYLSEKGDAVTVYTTNMGIHNISPEVKGTFFCKTNFSLIKNPFSVELIKRLKDSDEDIYHLHGYEFLTSLIAVLLLKNKPKILTQHGAEISSDKFIISCLLIIYKSIINYILHNVDMVIVLGENDRVYLQNYYHILPDKIKVIPNGIEIKNYRSNNIDIQNFVSKYKLKMDSYKILFVGRLIPTKNADKLINCCKNYMKDKNIEIIIIGPGNSSYIDYLKEIKDNRTYILGEVSFEELVAAYNLSNLYVQLGEWSEGMPTTILEAMSCGLPVLSTSTGNISDIIEEGKNGMLLKLPVNEQDLASKINYLMNIDTQLMKKNNIQKIERFYNWDQIAEEIRSLYQKAIDSHQ